MEPLKQMIIQMNDEKFSTVKKTIIEDYFLNDLLLLLAYRTNSTEELKEMFNYDNDYIEILNLKLYNVIQRIVFEL